MIEIPGFVFYCIVVTVFLAGAIAGLMIGERICNRPMLP